MRLIDDRKTYLADYPRLSFVWFHTLTSVTWAYHPLRHANSFDSRRYDQATQNVNAFPCYVKFHHRSLGLLGCLFKRFKTGGDVEDWLKAMAKAVPVFFWGPLDRLSICVRGLVTTASMQKGSVKVNWLDRVLMVQRLGVTPEQFEKSVRQLAPEMADVIGDWSQFRWNMGKYRLHVCMTTLRNKRVISYNKHTAEFAFMCAVTMKRRKG